MRLLIFSMSFPTRIKNVNSKQPTRLLLNIVIVAVVLTIATPAFAGTSGAPMPWEGPLKRLIESFTGPVAQSLMVLAVILLGLGLAFSDGGGFTRKVLNVLFGLSLAAAGSSFILDFFGFAAGAVV